MLALGVIAKFHADKFQQLVRDALPYVQEVIVAVDDDAAPGIEGFLSDRVTYFEWPLRMDFAAMRNAICERVTKDWVLFLDTDENLLPEFWPKLHCYLTACADVLLLPRANYYVLEDGTRQGPINYPDWQPKLHRRHVRWKNPVHEWPDGNLKMQYMPSDMEFAIQHVKTHEDQHYANRLYANILSQASPG